jgi:acyl-CoA synthetase (NDP forming)
MTNSGMKNMMDNLFHPASIAVIGARSNESLENDGWVSRLIAFGYSGTVYPINPKAAEIMGLKAYPNIKDVPGPVDLAIFNVPFRVSDKIMSDCAAKGVKFVHVYTAGFSETGKPEGIRLQNEIERIARESGIRVIGPNCMGLYYPRGGLTFGRFLFKEPGPLAFVSQSGASASRVIAQGNERGIYFSKVISYGNAIDLDGTDFIEYLSTDPETRVIASYIEGVKDGRRYFNVIRESVRRKPVIALKAGITEGGSRAAASHTAVLAGSEIIWDAFFKQTGVIRVDDLEELLDVAMAFIHLRRPAGRRVGIVGRGGGLGVVATDMCEKAGLKVPPFHLNTQHRLEQLIPDAGTSARNPVEPDKGLAAWAAFYEEGLKAIDEDPGIDIILTHLGVDIYGGIGDRLNQSLDETISILLRLAKQLSKPLVIVLYSGGRLETISAVLLAQQKCLEAGLPVYPSVPSAAKAITRFIGYHEFLDRKAETPK